MPDNENTAAGTLGAIKAAEDEAVKRRQDAIERTRTIAADAAKRAAELKSEATVKADAEYRRVMEEAERKAAEYSADAAKKAEEKALEYKKGKADAVKAAAALIVARAMKEGTE